MSKAQSVQTAEDTAKLHVTEAGAYLLRTSVEDNLHLSEMADHKASILMGAAFLVFTVSVGEWSSGKTIALSGACLSICSFLAVLLATIAILPATGSKEAPPEDMRNMLFFGTFGHFHEDYFVEHMLDVLEEDEAIARAMLRDLYQSGVVLKNKKYKYLRYAYLSLIVGLVGSFGLALAERAALSLG